MRSRWGQRFAMSQVELIYASDCPNVPAARQQLLRAFRAERMAPQWWEWDRDSADSPAYVRSYGSPTILINGEDVAGAEAEADMGCCRIYRYSGSADEGVPDAEQIRAALLRGDSRIPHSDEDR